MSIFIRILLVVGAIVLLAFMLRKIRLAKLKIEYTVFWIGFSCILVIMGVFPQIMSAISEFLGFKSTVNMVYLIVIFVLIVSYLIIQFRFRHWKIKLIVWLSKLQ